MQASFATHWFRFPTAVRDVECVLDVGSEALGGSFGPCELRGGFNQPRRFVHDSGAAVYFGSRVDAQPIVVDVPGEACEQLSTDQLCEWAENLGGAVSRLDVAADIEPKEQARARLLQMRQSFKRGRCTTRIPTASCYLHVNDDPAEGWTLDVGKRSSEVFIRAYDRRGPLRIEPEWKPARGVRPAVVPILRRYGAAGVWRMLAGHCVWPMPWFQQLLAGEVAEVVAAPALPDDLSRSVTGIRQQFGAVLAALQLLGFKLDDLSQLPERPNAQQVRQWAAFARQAPSLGYDGSKLQAEVNRWRRSK